MKAPIRRGAVAAAWLALGAAPPAAAQGPGVRVQIIDRGQADGIVVRTPNGRWVVIDGGIDRQQAESMADLWDVDSVALAVVSHRHRDHFGGMDEILRAFPVGRYVGHLGDCPGTAADDTIRAILARRGIPAQGAGADTIVVDNVRFIILPADPEDDACPGEENNNSVVVRMEFGAFSMLFTGDAETPERAWLMEHHPDLLDVAVLLATGGGLSTRQLYTDQDEIIFAGQRPIILNGIGEFVAGSDLRDRVLTATCPPIAEVDRRDEESFWKAFEAAWPRLLGALLDGVSMALRKLPTTALTRLPRMADFARWVVAAEPALGWPPGTFLSPPGTAGPRSLGAVPRC